MLETILFYLFSFIAVLFSGLMLTRKNALAGALCLIVCLLSFSGLYVMLDAPFVAVMQVMVYAGAIMMLIIFVIMTVDTKESSLKKERPLIFASLSAAVILVVCVGIFTNATREIQTVWSPRSGAFGTIANVGRELFKKQILNFEMISIVLLVALVGALVLGKKQHGTPEK